MGLSKEQRAKKMKEAREKKKLTQEEMAKMVGITVNYYARVERGEAIPSMTVLKNIVKILNLKSSDVLPF